tara:strand:- start:4555 stop:4743 length:189 start_codon:yes stop_codon:yes gene_type:complete
MKIKILEVRHNAVKNPVKYCFILSPLWLKSFINLAIDKRTLKQHPLFYPTAMYVADMENPIL